MKEKPKTESVVFKYTKANDYRVIAANGAYGGPVSTDEIKVDFYVESMESPNLNKIEVEEGKLGKVITRVPGETNWIRELQIGLLLSRDTAENIGKWLLEKVQKVDEQRAKMAERIIPKQKEN